MLESPFVINDTAASSVSTTPRISAHDRDYGVSREALNPDHYLQLSYVELEERNLAVRRSRLSGVSSDEIKKDIFEYLKNEKRIKAVTLCFTDLEGRLHLLDFDKMHIVNSEENLTFDGSSIKGFTDQNESDLRLKVDWTSFRWLPSDIFGAGKVLIFANVCDRDGGFYSGDYRGQLSALSAKLKSENGISVNIAPEIEGFLFKGDHSEQNFNENEGFELATMSGYFNCLPQDELRKFIDKLAGVQRALGYENEKDHPEVAPAQFELNYRYTLALDAADQVLLYKLIARQIARSMGFTASFLPKPIQGMNGSGMHTNISFSIDGKNVFYSAEDKNSLSSSGYKVITGILAHANDICLILNSSVNSYRRLDPKYEAPNEIKFSNSDRGSMIRIPIGNEKSARIEVRTVAPDVNPYLAFYVLIKAGMAGLEANDEKLKSWESDLYENSVKKLPGHISGALECFESSDFVKSVMGESNHAKYAFLKQRAADRSPRELGSKLKAGEILYHHEITNQMLWSDF